MIPACICFNPSLTQYSGLSYGLNPFLHAEDSFYGRTEDYQVNYFQQLSCSKCSEIPEFKWHAIGRAKQGMLTYSTA